jgi:predicted site-specific integrase-resolvase
MRQKTNVVVFSRVSTQIQDTLRQTEELKEYAERMNYQVLHVFEEKISGTKKTSERPILQSMLTFIENNSIQNGIVGIFPQPVKDILTLSYRSIDKNEVTISIYDIEQLFKIC